MKFINCSIFIIILLAGSCSPKSDPVPPCLLTKKTATYQIGSALSYTTTDTYTHDTNYSLVTWTQVVTQPSPATNVTYTYTYSYNSGKVVDVKYTFSGSTTAITSTWTNENGHLTKVSVPTYLATSLYTYDSQGRLTNWDYTSTSVNFISQSKVVTFDANGNLATSKVTEAGSPAVTTTYSGYDSKNNPYALLARAMGQPYFFSRLEGFPNDDFLSKNNPGSGSIVTGVPAYTYTYEYNAKGYPTKSIRTEPFPATLTTVFEYQNCD